jgi:hypothetical protein
MELMIVLSSLVTGLLVSYAFYAGYRMGMSEAKPEQPAFKLPSFNDIADALEDRAEKKRKIDYDDPEDAKRHTFFD